MLRLILLIPVLLVLVLFALSNRASVELQFWPIDQTLDVPLSLAVLAAMAVAFVLGGLTVWFSLVGARRRARRAEQALNLVERQLQDMQARFKAMQTAPRPTVATLPPPV